MRPVGLVGSMALIVIYFCGESFVQDATDLNNQDHILQAILLITDVLDFDLHILLGSFHHNHLFLVYPMDQ